VIAALVALPLLAPSVFAQDQAPVKPFKATADLGYVGTKGNSEVQTLTANDKLEWKPGRWLVTQDGAAVWGSDHGVENAGRYFVGLRGERELISDVSAYVQGGWRRNTFAAISRQFDESVGLAFHALKPNPNQLDFEAGVGLAQRRTTLGVQDDFSTYRLAELYRYYFREKTWLDLNGIYLGNFENSNDYEWDLTSALVAPVSGLLALKIGYNYHDRNAPPPGIKKWDSTLSAGLQVAY
jgi:putative salt-induced outer membrane protein YdiY